MSEYGCETQPWQWPDDRPHPLRHPCIGEEESRKLYEEVMR